MRSALVGVHRSVIKMHGETLKFVPYWFQFLILLVYTAAE